MGNHPAFFVGQERNRRRQPVGLPMTVQIRYELRSESRFQLYKLSGAAKL